MPIQDTYSTKLVTIFHRAYLYSSSSGAVFSEKVACHESPLLPILSQSHEVFIILFHSCPFCYICDSLRYWPPSAKIR